MDGSQVRVAGWKREKSLGDYLVSGQEVLLLERLDDPGSATVYTSAQATDTKNQWRRVDHAFLSQQDALTAQAPVYLTPVEDATPTVWGRWWNGLKPHARNILIDGMLVFQIVIVLWASLRGLPEVFWNPAAVDLLMSSLTWDHLVSAGLPVLTLFLVIAASSALILFLQWVLRVNRPGASLAYRFLPVVLTWPIMFAAQTGYAWGQGALAAHLPEGTISRATQLAVEGYPNTVPGLSVGSQGLVAGVIERINMARVSHGLPPLTADQMEGALRHLASDRTTNPKPVIHGTLRALIALDPYWREAAASGGMTSRRLGDIAENHLQPKNTRDVVNNAVLLKNFQSLAEDLDGEFRSFPQRSLAASDPQALTQNFVDAVWMSRGPQLADWFWAKGGLLGQLDSMAKGRPALGQSLGQVKSAVGQLAQAQDRGALVTALRQTEEAVNSFLKKLWEQSPEQMDLRGSHLLSRLHASHSTAGLMGPQADQGAFDMTRIDQAAQDMDRVVRESAADLTRTSRTQVPRVAATHRASDTKALELAPSIIGDELENVTLPALKTLGLTREDLSAVDRAIAEFRRSGTPSAFKNIAREIEAATQTSFQRENTLTEKIKSHPYGDLRTSQTYWPGAKLGGPVERALSGRDPQDVRPLSAQDLLNAQVALNNALYEAIQTHHQRLVSDFSELAPKIMTLPVDAKDNPLRYVMSAAFGVANFFLTPFFIRLPGMTITEALLNDNGDVDPVILRISSVHYGLLLPAVMSLAPEGKEKEMIEELDRIFSDFHAATKTSAGLTEALPKYFQQLDAFNKKLGLRVTSGAGGSTSAVSTASWWQRFGELKQQPGNRPDTSQGWAGDLFGWLLGTGRDAQAVENMSLAAGKAYHEMAKPLAEIVVPKARLDLPREDVDFSAAITKGTGDFVTQMSRQHQGLIRALQLQTGQSGNRAGLEGLVEKHFAGVSLNRPEEFVTALRGYVADLQMSLRTLAQGRDARFGAGADRELSDLVVALDLLRQNLANNAHTTAQGALDAVVGSFASGFFVDGILRGVVALFRSGAQTAASHETFRGEVATLSHAIFDKAYEVVGGSGTEAIEQLAGGERLPDFFQDGLPQGMGRWTDDQLFMLNSLKLRALRLAPEDQHIALAQQFDALAEELRQAGQAFSSQADLEPASRNYIQSVQSVWNHALALGPRQGGVKPTTLDLSRAFNQRLARNPVQGDGWRETDVKMGFMESAKTIADSVRKNLTRAPLDRNGSVAKLYQGSADTSLSDPYEAALRGDGKGFLDGLARVVKTARPDAKLSDWSAEWARADLKDDAAQEESFSKLVDAIFKDLARLDPTFNPAQVKLNVMKELSDRGGFTKLREGGFQKLAEYIQLRLLSMPDPNALNNSPSAALWRSLYQTAFLGEGSADLQAQRAASQLAQGLSQWSAAVSRVTGGPALSAKSLLEAMGSVQSEGDLPRAFERAFHKLDDQTLGLNLGKYTELRFSREWSQELSNAPSDPRSLMGLYLKIMQGSAFDILDQARSDAEVRADSSLTALGLHPTLGNALGALSRVGLMLEKMDQAGAGGAGTKTWAHALDTFKREWVASDTTEQAAALKKAWEGAAKALRESAENLQKAQKGSFPLADLVKSFDTAVKLDRSEGGPLTAADMQRGLSQGLDQAKKIVGDLLQYKQQGQDMTQGGAAVAWGPDQFFKGPQVESVLKALEGMQSRLIQGLTLPIHLVFGDVDVALPSLRELRGANLEQTKAWMYQNARAYDQALAGRSLRSPPGSLTLRLQSELSSLKDPSQVLARGFHLLDQGVVELLKEEFDWQQRLHPFSDLTKHFSEVAQAQGGEKLLQALDANYQPLLARAALFMEGSQTSPVASEMTGLLAKAILTREGAVGFGKALDQWVQGHPLGAYHTPQGYFADLASQASVASSNAGSLESARYIHGRLMIALVDTLERAYDFRVQGFSTGSLIATPLPEGFHLHMGPGEGLTVDSVSEDAQGIYVTLRDGQNPADLNIRVRLEGVPRKGGASLYQVKQTLAPGAPVLLATREGDVGREVTGVLYVPEGATGNILSETPGTYRSVNAGLGASTTAPEELKTLAYAPLENLTEAAQADLLSSRHQSALALAQTAYILSGGNASVREKLTELAETYFGNSSAQSQLPWWEKQWRWLTWQGNRLSGPEAIHNNLFVEHTADYLNAAMSILQTDVVQPLGGTSLDIERIRTEWFINVKASNEHQDATGARLWELGVAHLTQQLSSLSVVQDGLPQNFADSLRGLTSLADLPRIHGRLIPKVVDEVLAVRAKHGLPLLNRQELMAQGRALAAHYDAQNPEAFLESYRIWTLGLLRELDPQSFAPGSSTSGSAWGEEFWTKHGSLPEVYTGQNIPPVSPTVSAVRATYGDLQQDFSRALSLVDGRLTTQSLLDPRTRDLVARQLAKISDLPWQEKAALVATGMIPAFLIRRTYKEKFHSFAQIVLDKILNSSLQRMIFRVFFGLAVGTYVFLWGPALKYKWEHRKANRAHYRNPAPQTASRDLPYFQSFATLSLLAMVTKRPGENRPVEVLHPAFYQLPKPFQKRVLAWAYLEFRIQDTFGWLGSAFVTALRLTQINQVVMGVFLMFDPHISKFEQWQASRRQTSNDLPWWAAPSLSGMLGLVLASMLIVLPALAQGAPGMIGGVGVEQVLSTAKPMVSILGGLLDGQFDRHLPLGVLLSVSSLAALVLGHRHIPTLLHGPQRINDKAREKLPLGYMAEADARTLEDVTGVWMPQEAAVVYQHQNIVALQSNLLQPFVKALMNSSPDLRLDLTRSFDTPALALGAQSPPKGSTTLSSSFDARDFARQTALVTAARQVAVLIDEHDRGVETSPGVYVHLAYLLGQSGMGRKESLGVVHKLYIGLQIHPMGSDLMNKLTTAHRAGAKKLKALLLESPVGPIDRLPPMVSPSGQASIRVHAYVVNQSLLVSSEGPQSLNPTAQKIKASLLSGVKVVVHVTGVEKNSGAEGTLRRKLWKDMGLENQYRKSLSIQTHTERQMDASQVRESSLHAAFKKQPLSTQSVDIFTSSMDLIRWDPLAQSDLITLFLLLDSGGLVKVTDLMDNLILQERVVGTKA